MKKRGSRRARSSAEHSDGHESQSGDDSPVKKTSEISRKKKTKSKTKTKTKAKAKAEAGDATGSDGAEGDGV